VEQEYGRKASDLSCCKCEREISLLKMKILKISSTSWKWFIMLKSIIHRNIPKRKSKVHSRAI
jgi:hypothetical protein